MSGRDEGDDVSQRSGQSGGSGNMSETSSQKSDSKFLKKRALRAQHGANEETDLLEQKRNFQEGVFACMYTLVRQSALSRFSFVVLKVALEFLTNFIVGFNPSFTIWQINTSNPLWQVIRWTVWRSPIMRLYGYKTYVTVLYAMAAMVLLAVVGLVWLTLAMRKQEQSKFLRASASILHVVFDVMFVMFCVSFFDYFVFMADCSFTADVKQHLYFKGVMCLEMPHLMHMLVSLVIAVLFLTVTALMVIASSDLNPASLALLSTPASTVRLKILAAKAAYIVTANCLDSIPKIQSVLLMITVVLIVYWNLRAMPFYRISVGVVWTGLWGGILYMCVLHNIITFSKDSSDAYQNKMTQNLLHGMFPTVFGTAIVTALYSWWATWPARKFTTIPPGMKLSKVHKFSSVSEVEQLARVMRRFDQDGLVEEAAAALGETIIKAGLQTYPNDPHLLILYANFVLEVRKDGPAARTQLQLASKHALNIIQRYQIFCTNEASKRLKGSQQNCMDLQAYIEFKRNFRAVLRVHREVLVMQAEMWQLCMRPSMRVAQFDAAMNELEVAAARANQVYTRVLERYPNNGKLLRCYGKFLEDARHDPVGAVRAYTEANRSGAGGTLLSLDLSSRLHGGGYGKPDFLTSMSVEEDAVVVIDAEGTIMMVSQAVQQMFGYSKVELEGVNVSALMPQPFSQRHDGYLARYVSSSEPHILDSVREVVALHKDRYVFPVGLCVTKLSGVGADCIFLGVIRPMPPDIHSLRAWVAPNGVFLCSDQQFASAIGMFEGELVGHLLSSMVVAPEAVAALLERCQAASTAELESGCITAELVLRHRYREPVPMHAIVKMGGTDSQRILILQCQRTDGLDSSLLAVDPHMRVRFASYEVALLLGYSMRQLITMKLDQLLPQPFNALHAKWIRDPPHMVAPASCRSGAVVHIQAETGALIPVRLQISTADMTSAMTSGAPSTSSTIYVVQIRRVLAEEVFQMKRLVVTVDFSGRIFAVSPPDSTLFDFPAHCLVGANLADAIDIFADWRGSAKAAHTQLLLLALLYKEQELPGISWRVRVHAPEGPQDPRGSSRAHGTRVYSLSGCLQVEMADGDATIENAGDNDTAVCGENDTRIRLTLWRCDLMSGVVELDEDLIIRRASPLTGLITGVPKSTMLRKPLSRFLDLPPADSWEKLVAAACENGHHHHHKKSALKATHGGRGVISPVMAFIGPHSDTGTMRVMVQGVQTLGPGGRAKIALTLHPDTTFVGVRANLIRALRLDGSLNEEGRVSLRGTAARGDDDGEMSTDARSRMTSAISSRVTKRMKSRKPMQTMAASEDDEPAAAGQDGTGKTWADVHVDMVSEEEEQRAETAANDEDDPGRVDCGEVDGVLASTKVQAKGTEVESDDDDDDDDDGKGPSPSLHRQATSKSEFVAQWVRTLSKKTSGVQLEEEDEQPQQPQGVTGGRPEAGNALPKATSCRLGTANSVSGTGASTRLQCIVETIPLEDAEGFPPDGQSAAFHGADCIEGVPAIRLHQGSSLPRGGDEHALRVTSRHVAQDADILPLDATKSQKAGSESGDSSADGSQSAASGITSATDATSMTEYVVDARRGRLLKALSKLLLGPSLMKHVDRLRLQSYLIIAIMFIGHVISYCIITQLIKDEHGHVYSVHRQAMAMDRSQLIIVRSIVGAFCERANVTAKVSMCENPLSFTLSKLRTNIRLMEEYHHDVYLGFDMAQVTKLETHVYDIWTKHDLEYHVYMDTAPPQLILARSGVWQLGNRFIAAAREAQYLLPKLGDKYKLHRTYQFIKSNGLGPLFQGYAASLDLLVETAWLSIARLKNDLLTTLIVEAIFVQLCCTCYELYLVQRAEWARLLGVLAVLGLPGPVLRQLANKDTRIVGDSDDESDNDDDDSRGGEEDYKEGRGKSHSSGKYEGAGRGHTVLQLPDTPDEAARGGEDGTDGSTTVRPRLTEGGRADVLALLAADNGTSQQHVVKRGPRDDGPEKKAAAAGIARDGMPEAPGETEAVRYKALDLAQHSAGAGTGDVVSPRKGSRAKMRWGSRPGGRLHVNGKTLQQSFWNVSKFMVPFFLWNLAVILVYAVSLVKLNGMQGPLASLNAASHVTYRYTRVRAIGASFVTQDDAASRDIWRPLLVSELDLFESEYDVAMYGGTRASLVQSMFKRVIPAGTFASSAFAEAFFRSKRCFRYDQSTCFQPGHEYYEVTHNGLDVMVRRMVSEMRLLTVDEDQDVVYNSSRYMYMVNVGANDLYEGLQQAAELFVDYSIARYDNVALLHTVLLIVSVVLVLSFLLFVLWPHIRLLLRDAARLGALLSTVPPEMDVRGHVRVVLRSSVAVRGGQRQRRTSMTGPPAGAGAP